MKSPEFVDASVEITYRHYYSFLYYIIKESYFNLLQSYAGIKCKPITVLIECNFILLFYCVSYSLLLYSASHGCITHLYLLFKRTFGSNTFMLYSKPLMMCSLSSLPILFSGSLKSRDFLCVAGDLSHSEAEEATRGVSNSTMSRVEDPLDVISSTQIPIYNTTTNYAMLHFLRADHLPDILSKPIFLNIILLSCLLGLLCVISKNKLLGRY